MVGLAQVRSKAATADTLDVAGGHGQLLGPGEEAGRSAEIEDLAVGIEDDAAHVGIDDALHRRGRAGAEAGTEATHGRLGWRRS